MVRPALIAAVLAGTLLVFANLFIGSYAPRHFGPEHTLERSIGSRAEVLLLGTSTMVAAGDEALMAERLGRRVSNAAIGATTPFEHRLELRRLLEAGAPRVIVYGWTIGQLLPAPLDVGELVGNRAIAYSWSRFDDVRAAYPEFPPRDLANGFSFLARRAVPLLTYGSLIDTRIEALHRAIDGDQREKNQFGAKADFEKLARDAWVSLPRQLDAATHDGTIELSSHVLEIRALARAAHSRMLWVAMPLTSEARRAAAKVPAYRAYFARAAAVLGTDGDEFLDASALPELPDAMFSDGLHVAGAGARLFSEWLAGAIEKSRALDGADSASQR
jgi:hypothetical protein